MRRWGGLLHAFIAAVSCASAATAQEPRFHVLAFYWANAEPDHVQFAEDALKFFGALAAKQHFAFAATTEWGKLNDADPKKYQLVVWLNGSPRDAEQRRTLTVIDGKTLRTAAVAAPTALSPPEASLRACRRCLLHPTLILCRSISSMSPICSPSRFNFRANPCISDSARRFTA